MSNISKPLTIFTKYTILDLWQGSEYGYRYGFFNKKSQYVGNTLKIFSKTQGCEKFLLPK